MTVFEQLARIPVSHSPYVGSTDSLGNTVPSFGVSVSRLAYSIGPHVAERGSTTLAETAVAEVDLSMPPAPVSLKDRIDFGSGPHEVVGIRDMTKGFHGWQPGIVVELRGV